MMNPESRKDLLVLVADKNMEFSIKGVLERTEALLKLKEKLSRWFK
jgi:hypothetical protein